MNLLRIFFIVAAYSSAPSVWGANNTPTCNQANIDKAINILTAKIRTERLYTSWTKEQCLLFYTSNCNPDSVDINIRENHDKKCGGDQSHNPSVDSFRVYWKSKKINWYNYIDDEYVEFSKIYSIGVRQKTIK